jgi:phage tail-like protein
MSADIPYPTRYLRVRDRRQWDAAVVGLEAGADGNLLLARLPGPADGTPTVLPTPFDPAASGIVGRPCDAVFVADTAGNRVLLLEGLCAAQAELRGFNAPRGLAVGDDALWVADSGNHRVRRFAFPTLELSLDLEGFVLPTGVALDSSGRIYVLDQAAKRVRRFAPNGAADPTYDAAIAGTISAPLFLAIGADDALLVSDTGAVHRFDVLGKSATDLPGPIGGWQPGAIAAGAGRIYVADRADGHIQVFRDDCSWWCVLPDFQGPVTALATDPATGDLLIKCAFDGSYSRFIANLTYAASGTLSCGPFDAGQGSDWFRAALIADLPERTAVSFEIAQKATDAPPAATDWVAAAAPDTLLSALSAASPRRFLWLRLTVTTADTSASPTLRDLNAETPAEDYRVFLPATYSRADEPSLFLFRLLNLARTELGAVEENIDALPRLLSPDFLPASELGWLATWLGLELPRIASDDERRALIGRAIALWRRRGTPAGLADMVEIYTGVRPSIVEAYALRGLWILDVSSELGFDTGLPTSDPDGLVVPDPADPLNAGSCATTVGSAVVGQSGPLPVEDLGEPLFSDTAHRFTVFLPGYRAEQSALLAEVRRVIEAEKPAHTGYELCLVQPDMRVGFQATVGVDTIVGGPPTPLRLGDALLGLSATLPPPLGGVARIGQDARVGGTSMTLR